MTERVVYVPVEAIVKIRINNEDAILRATERQGEDAEYFNADLTAEDIYKHFAYNAVANGMGDVSRLDGWADLTWQEVQMDVIDVEFSTPYGES